MDWDIKCIPNDPTNEGDQKCADFAGKLLSALYSDPKVTSIFERIHMEILMYGRPLTSAEEVALEIDRVAKQWGSNGLQK